MDWPRLALCWWPRPRHAATVSVSGTTVIYQAAPGEVNKPLVDTIGTAVVFGDSVAPTFGAGLRRSARPVHVQRASIRSVVFEPRRSRRHHGSQRARGGGPGRRQARRRGRLGQGLHHRDHRQRHAQRRVRRRHRLRQRREATCSREGRTRTGSRASGPSMAVPATTSSRRSMASPASTRCLPRRSPPVRGNDPVLNGTWPRHRRCGAGRKTAATTERGATVQLQLESRPSAET